MKDIIIGSHWICTKSFNKSAIKVNPGEIAIIKNIAQDTSYFPIQVKLSSFIILRCFSFSELKDHFQPIPNHLVPLL